MSLKTSFQEIAVQQIADNIIDEKIYEGTTSVIYRAHTPLHDHPVIIKTPRNDHPLPAQFTRLKREFTLARSCISEHIVKVYRLEKYNKSLAIIMEDFGAIALADFPPAIMPPLRQSLEFAIKITEALSDIHQNNIVFKQLNPSNILLNPTTGQIKITDFGLATKMSLEHPQMRHPEKIEGDLAYISPEQTGRVHRPLDYRTDFYSLGVTLYELFTGRHPFDVDDSLELIHCHIAREPLPPDTINNNLPTPVARIIEKLMAKTAEQRYQSCSGLKVDLENCLACYNSSQAIPDFTLGKHDIPGTLKIPDSLYGRHDQTEQILEAFDGLQRSHARFILLTGNSGVGKTSLINTIQHTLVKKGAYFTSGKFEQQATTTPLAPLLLGFQRFIRQILTESKQEIALWKKKFNRAFGINGVLLLNIIPELELIVGPQPPVADLAPEEAENRFNLVFYNFVKACSSRQRPLVFFLDDIQWADAPTLNIIENLYTKQPLFGFLLICSCRNSDNDKSLSPIARICNNLQQQKINALQIPLLPLTHQHVVDLLADTLHCPPDTCRSLARTCLEKTGGNPFFLKQFLHALVLEQSLFFDIARTCWQWNEEAIRRREVTSNVADLMVGLLHHLPQNTQRALSLAAYIGNEFDIHTLAYINNGQSKEETLLDLQESLQKGFISPAQDIYQQGFHPLSRQILVHEAEDFFSNDTQRFTFAHDQIHQASYSLIPSENRRQQLHVQIGWFLLENTTEVEREKRLFDIVGHLNHGAPLIQEPQERQIVSQLNLQAGICAKESSAYLLANQYIQQGLQKLPPDHWQEHYALTLNLHNEATETAYLCGNFSQMEHFFSAVTDNARTLLDKVKVYEVRIRAMKAQNRLSEAVDTGMEILNLLGHKCSPRPSTLSILSALLKTRLLLWRKTPETLLNMPEMTDPYHLAAMTFLLNIGTAAYYTNPRLVPVISYKAIKLSLQYGNTIQATLMGYPTYGFILCGIPIGDTEKGYALGQLALNLQAKLHRVSVSPTTVYLVNNLIVHWKKHIRTTLSPLQKAYQGCLDIGELELAANSGYSYCYRLYFSGIHLKYTRRELKKYRESLQQIGEKIPLYRFAIFQQAVENLRITRPRPQRLMGEFYDEDVMIADHRASKDGTTLFIVHLVKMMHCVLFCAFSEAVEHAETAEQYIRSATGSVFIPLYYLYDSLARLALYNQATASEKKVTRSRGRRARKKMKKWARHAPMNYQHKVYLLDAELARVTGKYEQAMQAYDLAIHMARQHEYLQEEALSYELAARFYRDNNQHHIARPYLLEARYCYEMWEAKTKCLQLDEEEKRSTPHPSITSSAIITTPWTTQLPIDSQSSSALDLMAVLKASRTITGEIVLENLLKKMLHIMMESAGARKGYLFFPDKEQWMVRAAGIVEKHEVEVFTDIPSRLIENLPTAIIQYTARTKRGITLNNASNEGLFHNDPYIKQNSSQSVLCTPILHHDEISCILFLENNLTTGAFHHSRQRILNLIGAQAAISLQNSTLYSQLSATIEQLHEEIRRRKETQLQLLHSEKLSAVGRLSASIAHEFGNPMMGIQYLLEDIQQRPTLSEEDHELISLGLDECARMKLLIKDLQQFNRPSTDQKTLVDIHHVIDNTLMFQKKYLKTNKVDVVKDYNLTLPKTLAVEDQLTQVFVNLLFNAADALPETGGTVSITTSRDMDTLSVDIHDNGQGIAPKDQEKIFEPFFSTKTEVEGTGLGLPITYSIITAHDGHISFTSPPGKGTTFTVTLPIRHTLD